MVNISNSQRDSKDIPFPSNSVNILVYDLWEFIREGGGGRKKNFFPRTREKNTIKKKKNYSGEKLKGIFFLKRQTFFPGFSVENIS